MSSEVRAVLAGVAIFLLVLAALVISENGSFVFGGFR
jgi:hypothetical protein